MTENVLFYVYLFDNQNSIILNVPQIPGSMDFFKTETLNSLLYTQFPESTDEPNQTYLNLDDNTNLF